MNTEQSSVITECASLSMAGRITFADVVARLARAGVERYHADYTRMETTYYGADGESIVIPIEHERIPVAQDFSAAVVEASVRQSQRGEIVYPQFLKQTIAAGCVGYFVLITGKCVQYLGRNGEMHTEWFPGAARRP